MAWKFPPTTAVTHLREIMWNVGKFGDLHPFAALEPVRVGGVTVKLATLHNEEDLARKDIRSGDDVIVLRAGDVIPQVVSPAPHAVERTDRNPPERPPAHCPVCGTPTVKPGVFTKCPNRDCPDRRWQLLKHFAGAMDMEGLGEKQVAVLQRAGLVATAADFYALRKEQLVELEGIGEVSAEHLLASVAASRERPFGIVLFAIGIEGVGYVTGRNLAQQFRSIDALLAATADEIAATPGIGPVVAALIASQLADPQMRELIEALRPHVRFEAEGAPPGEGPLSGRTLVLTGTLPGPHARAGDGADPGRRRSRDLVGVAEDGLPRRRRGGRLQAGEGRAPRRPGHRRSRAPRPHPEYLTSPLTMRSWSWRAAYG